jgi:hypothetical protein
MRKYVRLVFNSDTAKAALHSLIKQDGGARKHVKSTLEREV